MGTPGTGIIVWQFVLLKHLADRQFTVVVDWERRTDRILFTRWAPACKKNSHPKL
jgi:hypothetical protein